ncbi:MAG: rhodanese-like domain-containing protein [Deltaproteobacteria bacterium]|nr:rhodanese-like domain-containing protein [Deltaproteobacteria bacterium]
MSPDPAQPVSCAADMERARYHFQILADTAADLSGLRHPHKILESFLLSAQGGVGARGGFAAILGSRPEDFHLVTSPRSEHAALASVEDLTLSVREMAEGRKIPFFVPCLPTCPHFSRCELLLVCPLGDHWHGLLGLEGGMRGVPYDDEERQLLTGLALLFQTSLRFALFSTQIELLNVELRKRNDTLDRQVFHLSALRELSQEITRTDLADVAENLLLTVLGHFSRSQGLILIHDRDSGAVTKSVKGVETSWTLSPGEVDRLFFLCLAGARNKHFQPLQVEPVETLAAVSELPIGFVPRRAFLFMLREQLYGVVLLGAGLGPDIPGEDDMLLTFLSQAVLLLKNADSFATIRTLNADLVAQNEELRRTINELTRAKDHINVLEAAGRRIAGIVHRRSEQLLRMRWVDFALIIGLSLGMGFIFNHQSPWGIPLIEPAGPNIPTIGVDAARVLVDQDGAILIDARPREFYEVGHAQGAVNIPAQLFDLVYMMQMAAEDPERPIVIYGRSRSRHYDSIVARKFLSRDHERVLIVEGDMPLTKTTDEP